MLEGGCCVLGYFIFFDLFIRTGVASIQIVSSCLWCCGRPLENLCKVTICRSHFMSGGNISYLTTTCVTNFLLWLDPLHGDVLELRWVLLSPGQKAAEQSGVCVSFFCFVHKDLDLGKTHLVSWLCVSRSCTSHRKEQAVLWGEDEL